jgi:DNA-binding NtrC family response regulator
VTSDALALLAQQPWPGNVRELRNALEQAALLTDDLVLEARHFGVVPALQAPVPRALAAASSSAYAPVLAAPAQPALRPLGEQVAEVERTAIAAALLACGGNRVQAARRLGMSRAALYDRLGRFPELGT